MYYFCLFIKTVFIRSVLLVMCSHWNLFPVSLVVSFDRAEISLNALNLVEGKPDNPALTLTICSCKHSKSARDERLGTSYIYSRNTYTLHMCVAFNISKNMFEFFKIHYRHFFPICPNLMSSYFQWFCCFMLYEVKQLSMIIFDKCPWF